MAAMVDWILWAAALMVLATLLLVSHSAYAEQDGSGLCGGVAQEL
jgi:hypothetical protein